MSFLNKSVEEIESEVRKTIGEEFPNAPVAMVENIVTKSVARFSIYREWLEKTIPNDPGKQFLVDTYIHLSALAKNGLSGIPKTIRMLAHTQITDGMTSLMADSLCRVQHVIEQTQKVIDETYKVDQKHVVELAHALTDYMVTYDREINNLVEELREWHKVVPSNTDFIDAMNIVSTNSDKAA